MSSSKELPSIQPTGTAASFIDAEKANNSEQKKLSFSKAVDAECAAANTNAPKPIANRATSQKTTFAKKFINELPPGSGNYQLHSKFSNPKELSILLKNRFGEGNYSVEMRHNVYNIQIN